MDEPALLPRPRQVEFGRGSEPVGDVSVALVGGLPPEGYRIRVSPGGAAIDAADEAGVAHGQRTLDQLTSAGRWRHTRIEDWPDFAVRGVMLDVSRDKVPTMATMEALIDQLASWKINHLELYVEHTLAHPGFEEVWLHASPFTPEEIAHLDRLCADRFIELSPLQNTLGHMERYLVHPRFRHLALEPEGFTWLGFLPRPPATLDPRSDEAFAMVTRLVGDWTDALPTASRFHAGLDEPWELGDDMLGDYLTWLERLRRLPALEHRELMMHGDVLGAHPELVSSIPDGVTVTEWGYEADHPWEQRLGRLAQARVPRWVMCGTSAWSSLFGRTTNMMANIAGAIDAALADGEVEAVVNSDWGDWGHHQQLPVSYPGLAWGAAQSWCRSSNRDLDLATALDRQCHDATGDGWGASLMALGDAHRSWGREVPNIAACFLNLWMNQLPVRGEREGVDAVRDDISSALALGDPGPEIRASVALAMLLLDDDAARLDGDGTIDSVPESRRRRLDLAMDKVIEAHRATWLGRNRPGGLDDSVAWLTNLQRSYRSGRADPSWSGPLHVL